MANLLNDHSLIRDILMLLTFTFLNFLTIPAASQWSDEKWTRALLLLVRTHVSAAHHVHWLEGVINGTSSSSSASSTSSASSSSSSSLSADTHQSSVLRGLRAATASASRRWHRAPLLVVNGRAYALPRDAVRSAKV
jgi:hypothetical protein